MLRPIRKLAMTTLVGALAILAGASVGLGAASLTTAKAAALQECEHDRCSRLCLGNECAGDCYDSPGSNRGCNMNGNDCTGYACGPSPH